MPPKTEEFPPVDLLRQKAKEQFSPPRPQGLLSRFFPPRDVEGAFEIRDVERYALSHPAADYRLFWVRTAGRHLPQPVLPAGGSRGLAAWSGGGLFFLSPDHPQNVRTVLNSWFGLDSWTGAPGAPPRALAMVCIDGLLSDRRAQQVLVESPEAVAGYHWGSHGYQVNDEELSRTAAELDAPSVESIPGGWCLSYCALRGWQYRKEELVKVAVECRAGADLVVRQRSLSRAIFRAIPSIRI